MEARLLFIGLWTLADRAGRLEDRPKQIKMDVFPADSVDCDALLNNLAATGMVVRYKINECRYLQVVNFAKHQNPHRDEKPSTLPDMDGHVAESEPIANKHSVSTVQTPCKEDAATVAIGLIPDPLIPDPLIPDSLIPDPLIGGKTPAEADATKPKKRRTAFPEDFYPDEVGIASASGISLEQEIEAFKNFHTGKGNLMADWQAAWRTWCGNAKRFLKASQTLPAWREQQRSETQKAVPRIALGVVNPNTFFTELGASNVTALKLG